MSFRARLLLAFVVVFLIPVIVLALAVRKEVGSRLTAQYERSVASLVAVIEDDLETESEAIAATLAAFKQAVVDDNRFRMGAVDRVASERRYLLDYAGRAMQLTGLSMLQIQDESGRIISSGHFRNEYDRLEPGLPELLAAMPGGVALVQARTPEVPFLALARVDSFSMAGRSFWLVGGVSAEQRFLARLAREGGVGGMGGMTVSLIYPGGVLTSGGETTTGAGSESSRSGEPASDEASSELVEELEVPFIDAARGETVTARVRVSHPLTELHALRRSIDIWFLVAVATTGFVALLLATWLSSRISRPLVELARKTSRIDLDRLDVDFRSARKDEIGALSRLLGAMTERLRASAGRIKEAERRATLGELARQVNHDIKNGLIPIRNVFRHLERMARDEPKRLPGVFAERRGTIDSSIAYLENLASNYARLYPRIERQPCDVNAIARRVVTDARGSGPASLEMDLCEGAAEVVSDPVVLRRIIENLVDNAIESLESRPGRVTVSTERLDEDGERASVRITVADTGIGMSEEELEKIFDDFYTTREGGTGLGLSIVRRLVMDLNGSVKVESERGRERGRGSRFIVELPLGSPAPGAQPARGDKAGGGRA